MAATEFHHRQAVRFEKTNPLSRLQLSNHHFYLAQVAWAEGNRRSAMKNVNLAIHYNPQNRAAIDLRADIHQGVSVGDHTLGAPFRQHHPLDAATIAPWILEGLDPHGVAPAPHPLDPGTPGPFEEIQSGGF